MPSATQLPPNNRLTGLPTLLDVDAVREQLNAAGAQVEGGRVSYVWYKPDNNCIAAYEFEQKDQETGNIERALFYGKCFTPEAFAVALHKVQTHRWAKPTFGPAVLQDPEKAILFYAFPNDPGLEGLSLLQTPGKLKRFLEQNLLGNYTEESRISKKLLKTEVVRYKPERRAVFRSNTKSINLETGDSEDVLLYWRVDHESQTAELSRKLGFLTQNLCQDSDPIVPKALGDDPECGVLLMEAVPGQPLLELLQSEEATSAAERTGTALAHLHALVDEALPSRTPEDFLSRAIDTQATFDSLPPEFAVRARRILAMLEVAVPNWNGSGAVVHGDFYYDQVLIGPKGVGFVDFDRCHTGCPLTDLGSFLAYLKRLKLANGISEPDEIADAFLRAYQAVQRKEIRSEELRWWTGLSLYLLALVPFHLLERNWPDLVQEILSSAERELC